MSDSAGLEEPRLRSPSPGRGGRFDDGGRRSPPPPGDRWNGGNGPPGSNSRGRSVEFGRKRRRDESPPSRDRYIPNYEHRPVRHGPNPEVFDDPYRRSGNAHRDDMFTYSPDRGLPGRGGPNHSRSHLTPPSELPHLVSFRYFADFMRSTSPHIAEDKEKLAEQWKRYRQDHTRKQLVAFFEENKSKAWFREKYQPGPEFEELRQRLKKKGREGKIESFISRLEKGDLDILNYDYASAPTSIKRLVVPKSLTDQLEDRGTSGLKTDPGPAAPSTQAPTTSQDGEIKESTLPPKPDSEVTTVSEVGKVKTESDADVKNEITSTNPDAEGEDYEEPDDEFSASMAEALNGPNTGLAPSSALGSLIGESMRGKMGSDDIVILPPADNQLFIKSISPDISRTELENHCKQVEGFDYLALSDPHTGKKLHRVGWVSFVPGTDMKAAESALGESKINNFTLHLMRTERPAFQKLRLCPGIMNTHERIIKDLGQIRKLAACFEAEYFGTGSNQEKCGSTAIEAKISKMKDETGQNLESTSKQPPADTSGGTPTPQDPGLNPQDSDLKPDLPEEKNVMLDKKALDFYIYYLRTVFNCCYYCVCICDFQEELCRRCPKHVRKAPSRHLDDHSTTATPQSHRRNANSQNSTHLKSNESNWARTLDDRVALILTPSEVDPREFGGERIDDEIHRLCQPQITDEGAGKFRCKSCSKLFKAMNFIEKHIMSKHGEVINQDSIERIKYLNNYILDPSHTTPQPPPPPEYGHSRTHNGISAGPSASHGMMPSMGHGHPADFHNGGYPPMMNSTMSGPGGMMMGGPYGNYMPPMYPPYGPGHSYPPPMSGPPPMFPNGPMMSGHGNGGGPSYGGPYYMGNMGPGAPYPPAYQPHHQVYSSLPAIPPPARPPNGNARRLGDRISRHFADDLGLPAPPHHHDHKRSRRDDFTRPTNGSFAGSTTSNGPLPPLVASDPRSKTVLAYNDLDTPAGDEVVLNY
ncbi:hypothetical protein PGT21_009587 [Puccinia graminis f. sp. tritici]|uniref:C2H2-type domain-containing protein n=1 Tax=Puccinia graminis f. sp. tritici TaxID=56615 RepID=A0A5B0NBT9_PUCGR|nr:hypothetical protein PGT21_009587 [Puccinia graminis f. sp. tritici]